MKTEANVLLDNCILIIIRLLNFHLLEATNLMYKCNCDMFSKEPIFPVTLYYFPICLYLIFLPLPLSITYLLKEFTFLINKFVLLSNHVVAVVLFWLWNCQLGSGKRHPIKRCQIVAADMASKLAIV